MEREVFIKFSATEKFEEVDYTLKMTVRDAVLTTLMRMGFAYDASLSVTFCDNAYIKKLNAKYRGVDKPTDVLSFPLFDYDGVSEEPPVDEILNNLGDIVISLERAKEQAEEYGHSFKRETAFLCVHSMLHLLGYDHEKSEEDDRDMRARQTEIMRIMGLEVK